MGRLALVCLLLASLAACAGPGKRAELADIHYQLGVGYYRQGDYAMALEKLERAQRLEPDRVDVLMVKALSEQALGRWEEAERDFRLALEQLEAEDPDPGALALAGDLHNNFGVFLCARGRHEEALRHFRAALADPNYRTPAAAWENLGVCALEAGEMAQARRALKQALALAPERTGARLALARLHWRTGELEAARRQLARAEAQGPLGAADLWFAAQLYEALGEPETAQRYRARLLERYPRAPEAVRLRQIDEGLEP